MATRSFCPAATRHVVDLVCAKGWARDEVEPVVVAHLAAVERVLICFNVECAVDYAVGKLSEGFWS